MAGVKKPKLFYGYIVAAAAVSIMTIVWGANRTFGVFLEPMLDEFGWTRAGISGAFTLCMVVMGLVAIVAGRLTDKIGPRPVLLTCGFFLGLGYILISWVSAIWQLYLFYGVIIGIGMSGTFAPLLSLVARWFVRRRALMSGVLVAGPAFGIVVMPLVSSLLISAYGWRNSYVILGGIVLVIVVSAALFLKRDPGGMGLVPYGADESSNNGLNTADEGFSFQETVRTKQFWMLGLMFFCSLFIMNVVVVHIVIHAVGLGIPATTAASILSVAAGVSIPGRIIMGIIADRMGNRPSLAVCYIMGLVAFILLLVARELWMLYLFAVIFGLGWWASSAVMVPLTAELFGLKSHGTIVACVNLITAVGGAAGPVLVGHIFDVTGSYQQAFLMCIAVTIIAITTIIFMKPVTSR